jgi:hypothetical protein
MATEKQQMRYQGALSGVEQLRQGMLLLSYVNEGLLALFTPALHIVHVQNYNWEKGSAELTTDGDSTSAVIIAALPPGVNQCIIIDLITEKANVAGAMREFLHGLATRTG